MKKLLFALLLCSVCGCINQPIIYPESDSTTMAVLVGITNGSGGFNTVADKDLAMMKEAVSYSTDNIVTITDLQASKKNVIEALSKACEHELAIFYFSGHGGEIGDIKDKTEVDGKDEFLCLTDSWLYDNEIWSVISKSTNRVVLVFDCCFAGTMYKVDNNSKSDGPIAAAPYRPSFGSMAKITDETTTMKMLCLGGSEEGYVGVTKPKEGGYFTLSLYNTIVKGFNGKATYAEVWTNVNNSRELRAHQRPAKTNMNNFDENVLIFR